MSGYQPELQRLVDNAVNPFCLIDAGGTILWAGASIAELLGVSAADLVGTSVLDVVAPESVEQALRSLAVANEYVDDRSGSGARQWEGMGPVARLVRPDGSKVSCSVSVATPVRTGLPGYVLQLRRSDYAHALENALIAMGEGRTLREVMTEVASMLEGELPAADVAVFTRRPGDGYHAVVGPTTMEHVLAGPAPVGAAIWESALAEPGTVHEWAIDTLPSPLRSVAAAQGYQWVSLYAVPDSEGGPSPAALVVWSSHDFAMHVFTHERVQRCGSLVALVTQWERGQRALRWEATHDVLTGLHNRSFFLNELASIAPFEPPSALLYLDLDDFKPVNDEHGHRVGDNVLVEVATRLRRSVRPSDIVARLGGDEFAVLCRDLDDAAAAEVLCARLVDAVGQPLAVDGVEVQVGLSVGLALLEADEDPERALNRADMALRRAKVDGKRRWRRASDVAALASTV